MGYRVSTIASISLNDNHAFYIYFLPGREYRGDHVERVNTYFSQEFENLAKKIGPSGVIIAPHEGRAEEYISSITDLRLNGCLFAYQDGFERDEMENHFHNGQPYLIVTSEVLHPDTSEIDGFIVNLDTIPDQATLGEMMHLLLRAIEHGDLSHFVDNFVHWERSYERENLPAYTSAWPSRKVCS